MRPYCAAVDVPMVATAGSAVVHTTGQPSTGWGTEAVTRAVSAASAVGQVRTYGLSSAIALTVPGGVVGLGTTVTFTLEDLPYPVTVIVATPTATAVTLPSSPDPATEAT